MLLLPGVVPPLLLPFLLLDFIPDHALPLAELDRDSWCAPCPARPDRPFRERATASFEPPHCRLDKAIFWSCLESSPTSAPATTTTTHPNLEENNASLEPFWRLPRPSFINSKPRPSPLSTWSFIRVWNPGNPDLHPLD